MPVITTSRMKKLLCQTLIREKLSYKIIFQSTTFLFSPLKLKKQLYEKIKFKKPLFVFKTDKIANLHGHEVLRTPVRHCELNPIELIKGFVAENNTTFRLKDVKELVYGGFGRITKEVWAKAEEHVLKIEKGYGKENCMDRSEIPPIIIDFDDKSSDEES
jgi:hypothetical protein